MKPDFGRVAGGANEKAGVLTNQAVSDKKSPVENERE